MQVSSVADGFADVRLELCAEAVSEVIFANNSKVGAGGSLSFPPSYSVGEYFGRCSSRIDSRHIVIIQNHSTFTVMIGRLERETALVRWRHPWMHLGGGRGGLPDSHQLCGHAFCSCCGITALRETTRPSDSQVWC